MKKILLIAVVLAFGCTSEPPLNQETVNYNDETILVGEINWDGLNKEGHKEWFAPGYLDYQVDAETLDYVGENLNDVEVVMFLGTWCSDSQQQVPQFYKILDYVGYDINTMTVYALERKLEPRRLVSPGGEEAEYAIELVPTMVFYRDGAEIGRITEYPEKTLEKDLVEIVSQ
ncbi:MAG: hypothetical protein ABFS32_05885 [Bacteroidota bacterium]